MKKEDLNFFRQMLTKWLEDLISQADDTVNDLMDRADNSPDPVDRASFESDRNFTLRIRDRESKLIKKIRKCLEDIEEGTYGICEMCGEEISIERLKARPVTTHCIECKTKKEAFEKAAGI